MFSKENIIVDEENGKKRGLFLAYPARDMMKLAIGMLICIKDIFTIICFLNFLKDF